MARPEGHQDPSYLAQLIREEGITTLHFVPSMLPMFLEEEGVEDCSLGEAGDLQRGGVSYELQERFFGRMGGGAAQPLRADGSGGGCDLVAVRPGEPRGSCRSGGRSRIRRCTCWTAACRAGGDPGELYFGGVRWGGGTGAVRT